MTDMELAEEIERHISHRPPGFVIPPYQLYEADAKQIIAALRRGHELQAMILRCRNCGSTNVEDAQPSSEMLQNAFDAGINAASGWADPWKTPEVHKARDEFISEMAKRPPSGEMVMVPREPTGEMVIAAIREHHRQLSEWEKTRRGNESFKLAPSFIYRAMLSAYKEKK